MTLKQAIDILTEERKEHHGFSTDIIGQAEQLAIEALTRIHNARVLHTLAQTTTLPGETEE